MVNIGRAIWARTDNITKWIQVIALCVAAWWTFTNYSVADKPSLEPNIDVGFSWGGIKEGWEPDTCRVGYNLTVTNAGKVSFDVDKIQFRAWHSEIPSAKPQEATFVDAENFSHGTLIIEQTIAKAYLLRHYAPGQKLPQSFTWILRRQKKGITTFIVDVSATSGKHVAVGHGRFWDDNICIEGVELKQ